MCSQAIKRKDGAQPAANEEMHLIVTDYCCHKFHYMPEPGLLVSTQTFTSLRGNLYESIKESVIYTHAVTGHYQLQYFFYFTEVIQLL